MAGCKVQGRRTDSFSSDSSDTQKEKDSIRFTINFMSGDGSRHTIVAINTDTWKTYIDDNDPFLYPKELAIVNEVVEVLKKHR